MLESQPSSSIVLDPHIPFDQVLAGMKAMYDRKRADYAAQESPLGNLLECSRCGIAPQDGVMTRITDKVTRLYNLYAKEKQGEGPQVVEESLNDTLLDLANYAVLLLVMRKCPVTPKA